MLRHTAKQSAIQIATASAAVTTVDLILNSREKRQGFVEQETLDIDDFLANDFAQAYRDAELSI